MDSTDSLTIDNVIAALKAGKLAIVIDVGKPLMGGAFVAAAERTTPETIDVMLRIGRGILAVAVGEETVKRLRLRTIVDRDTNTCRHRKVFMVPLDHRDSGTGVSAANRALTIREIANPVSAPGDFVQPGHITPLSVKEGGVLCQSGHAEAAVDLLRIAEMQPAAALIEILSPDGRGMANRSELRELSKKLRAPIVDISELIRHRRMHERLLAREFEIPLPTRFGELRLVVYSMWYDDHAVLAIVWGDLKSLPAPLACIHSSHATGDLLGALCWDRCDRLQAAMATISREGVGVIVYRAEHENTIRILRRFESGPKHDGCGWNACEGLADGNRGEQDRFIGFQVLKELGLSRVRLLTDGCEKDGTNHASQMGIEVVEEVSLQRQVPCMSGDSGTPLDRSHKSRNQNSRFAQRTGSFTK